VEAAEHNRRAIRRTSCSNADLIAPAMRLPVDLLWSVWFSALHSQKADPKTESPQIGENCGYGDK
jgi:hypothetical protein